VSARDDFQRDLERAGELVRAYDQDGDIEPLVEFANRDTETRAYFAALIARSGSRLPEPEDH
jgi:ABC-type phosphate/phosphonate transport system substrate-binding protein